MLEEEEKAMKSFSTFKAEVRINEPSGNIRWSSLVSTPRLLKDGSILWDGLEVVISDRKKSEENMLQSLREKETLIRELYHRTKNTMQIISGMIMLQASNYPSNKELHEMVRETNERIQAISLVHEMLYKSQDLSKISIRQYIQELSFLIMQSFGIDESRIKINFQIEEQFFLIDTIIPIGLILNELMTNSFKYAFPEDRKGDIFISLKNIGLNQIVFDYADNGVGVSEDFNFKNMSSLGLKLIYNIGERQMQGKVTMKNNNGLSCRIEFKNNLYQERV